MLSLLTITAALSLLTPIRAATPAEVELGKLEGFTGGPSSSHSGDYLTSTFCFCAQPDPTPQHYSEANYLQFEYYNSHQNTTFILDHLCLADQDSATTCLAPRNGDGAFVHHGADDWHGAICRTWYSNVNVYPLPGPHVKDTLCYEPHPDHDLWREWRMPGPDVLRFNGQSRHLDPMGGQGPVLKGLEEAEGVCGGLCVAHAGMAVLRGNDRAQCHVVVYEDLDDMCVGCA